MPDFDLGVEPRDGGLTHVLDKGLGPRAWEDVLETAGRLHRHRQARLGHRLGDRNLERKLEVLRDKPVVIGGTFFEVVYAKDKLDEYKRWLRELGLTHVEISDGTVEIPRERKLELIADFARDFTVLSEVGSKDSEVVFAAVRVGAVDPGGAGRRRLEGDHRGARGRHGRHLPARAASMRTGLVDEIAHAIDFHDLDLRGADQGAPGVVRQALRPRRSTSATSRPTRSSRSRRSGSACAATR